MTLNSKNEKVTILMSTFNGEKYLVDQINSLLEQDYFNFDILIRDDGSTDNTVNILNDFERQHENIQVKFGKNKGAIDSFFELLKLANESNYYAFCDQDDVWLKDKISKAIEKIKEKDSRKPLLYGSGLTVVDENLKLIRKDIKQNFHPTFGNSLLQNVITGCTIVINNVARKQLLKEIPTKLRMHDWWMYQVISGVGEVIYDKNSKILYRQHANNTVGSYKSKINLWEKRIKRYRDKKSIDFIVHHAKEINRIYRNNLSKENQKTLDDFLSIREGLSKRIKFVFNFNIVRHNLVDDIIFKLLVLLKKI